MVRYQSLFVNSAPPLLLVCVVIMFDCRGCFILVPEPFVLTWEKRKNAKLDELVALIDAIKSPRLVLGKA